MKRHFRLGFIFLFFIIGPRAVDGASETPRRGGTVRMSTLKGLSLTNPLVSTQSTEKRIRQLVYEPLLEIGPKGEIEPNLAESWEISKDGKLYTFPLRRGVRFHNGREMTAEDVKFSMDYTINPKNGAYGFSQLRIVNLVEAADRYTVKVHLKASSPGFLPALADIATFSVIPKNSLDEGMSNPTEFPPGTGPFRITEWVPEQRIVFDRFGDYWGHKAFLDRVVFVVVRDATVQFTALRAGDVEMVERTPYPWVKEILDGKTRGIQVAQASHAGFRRLTFNVAAPPFDNKKLRHSVAHAMDKKEILQAAYFGFGETTDQKYPRGHIWHLEGLPFPSFDPNKAKASLKESGYKGETIELLVRQGQDAQDEALALQAQLRRIGMNVKLDVMEPAAYTARRRQGAFAFSFDGSSFGPEPWATYAPDFQCPADLKKRVQNSSGYCNKEVDALFKKAESEMDFGRRREIFRQILTHLAEDLPSVNVSFIPRFYTFRDSVKGFTTDPSEGSYRWSAGGLNYTWLESK
jgi:peptide/nickel transport system substrate-binding protein